MKPARIPSHQSPPSHQSNPGDTARSLLASFFVETTRNNEQRRAAVALAVPALDRLCEAMRHRTDQSAHLRDLLYSLWNGQPTSLLEVVSLDWPLRQDLTHVILAFGFEDLTGDHSFYYDQLKAAIVAAGLWEWFIAAHHAHRTMGDHAQPLRDLVAHTA